MVEARVYLERKATLSMKPSMHNLCVTVVPSVNVIYCIQAGSHNLISKRSQQNMLVIELVIWSVWLIWMLAYVRNNLNLKGMRNYKGIPRQSRTEENIHQHTCTPFWSRIDIKTLTEQQTHAILHKIRIKGTTSKISPQFENKKEIMKTVT